MDRLSNLIASYKAVRYNAFLKKIDQKMKEIKKLQAEVAFMDREKDTLEYLSIDQASGDCESSLTLLEDKIRIIEDMMKDFGGESCFLYSAIFSNVDNIRCIYKEHGKDCPSWFVEKYGRYFLRKN